MRECHPPILDGSSGLLVSDSLVPLGVTRPLERFPTSAGSVSRYWTRPDWVAKNLPELDSMAILTNHSRRAGHCAMDLIGREEAILPANSTEIRHLLPGQAAGSGI
jgi:hypothetical protein